MNHVRFSDILLADGFESDDPLVLIRMQDGEYRPVSGIGIETDEDYGDVVVLEFGA